MREQPEILILCRIKWQFFGTLTFRSESLSDIARCKASFAFFREIASGFQVPFPRLLWCLRAERGEMNGRAHYHFLAAGFAPRLANPKTCFWMMHQWEKVLNRGFARVAVFDPKLSGLDYVSKNLGLSDKTGAHSYESAKFSDDASALTLSDSIAKVVKRMNRCGETARPALRNTQGL